MRISARCDYACRALLELSKHWPDKSPLPIHAISERQDIPMRYLVHILIQLKRIGLVISIRGKEGGYNLAKAPHTISLYEVIRQTGGPLLPVAESAAKKESIFAAIWNDVENAMSKALENITFDDVMKKAEKVNATISYQI